MNYEKRIDEETWAFIQKASSFSPDDGTEQGIGAQRAQYNAMAAAFRQPRSDLIEVTERTVGALHVSVRIYTAGDPTRTVMYCHGGGFVLGDLNSHDDICCEICEQTGYRVVASARRSPGACCDRTNSPTCSTP